MSDWSLHFTASTTLPSMAAGGGKHSGDGACRPDHRRHLTCQICATADDLVHKLTARWNLNEISKINWTKLVAVEKQAEVCQDRLTHPMSTNMLTGMRLHISCFVISSGFYLL